jgi:signal transduction histidine kinase/ActR/RegA family two-component response regulator
MGASLPWAASIRRIPDPLGWQGLPRLAQAYVAIVTIVGTVAFVTSMPRALPDPWLLGGLLLLACVTSAWKVTLPLSLSSGATLSVSYAADLMTLLLLGPEAAVIVAVAGAWMQCTFKVKQTYPLYRTVFSMAAEAITMVSTGLVFVALGGEPGSTDLAAIAKPLVGAIATYFVVNTNLVGGAIALSSARTWWQVWHDEFLWSAPSFIVAGSAGALAAVIIQSGRHWEALLLLAPVYLTYRTYQIFVGRFDDQRRHVEETQRLHSETLEALRQALNAEQALAQEKERLGKTLAEMTRLEEARRQLLDREHAARGAAEQANRLKDQFLAVVSHELRTPLNAILGWSELLQSGRLDESKRERASRAILDSAKRQAQLIEELLDVARIMSGKLRLERSAVDLREIVQGALAVVQPVLDAKRINIVVDASPLLGTVFADSSRLQQVVWNLLSNAVKYTPEGGTVRVEMKAYGSTAEMVVADSGPGIPPEFLPHVFEPFRQADASTTRTYAGLGLGLSIVRQIVEAHGGTVTAQNAIDRPGAVFSVRLPIIAVRPQRRLTDAPVSPSQKDQDVLGGLCVLVVDDDYESRHVVAAHLESCNAHVLTAASAPEALDLLQHHQVQVLLADIAMPGEDGYSLIRKLRAMEVAAADIPAAALTAFAREEDRQLALEAGFQLHLAKPIDASSLIAAVAALARWDASNSRNLARA